MSEPGWNRREILRVAAAAGVGSAVFTRALTALAAEAGPGGVTPAMIGQAEWVAGIALTDAQRELMAKDLDGLRRDAAALRAVPLDNAVAPALVFRPDALGPSHAPVAPQRAPERIDRGPAARPASPGELAFLPATRLAALLAAGELTSVELTQLCLDRIARYDPELLAFVTVTPELALAAARRADAERAAGRARGPLHGVPFVAKDLLSYPGVRTTWGAGPFRDQVRPEKATAIARLEEAGGVLLGKTAVGELAWGDVWYGGTTKNPWKPAQGSSGSSAGTASSVAAGLAPYGLGTETWGSIVSPCTRCGATGLRPTFGRVSRHGAMALSWSMDKVGTIARSVEDCALAFAAIHGADGLDPTAVDRPFAWPPRRDPRSIRVGVVRELFEADYTKWADTEDEKPGFAEWQALDRAALDALAQLGLNLLPVKPPETPPVGPMALILTAEAASAFDEFTLSGGADRLVRQVRDAWPNVFRQGRFIAAADYLRANRVRALALAAMERLMAEVEVLVVPSFGGDMLLLTNLTGHPAVVVPDGFRPSDGTPTSLTFIGRLYGETELLAVAHAYQQATGFALRHPSGFVS
jgi:Asp-tRNA(Asn)/Glu-tRNA(Gln) amidotransferase A subunit family amidase